MKAREWQGVPDTRSHGATQIHPTCWEVHTDMYTVYTYIHFIEELKDTWNILESSLVSVQRFVVSRLHFHSTHDLT